MTASQRHPTWPGFAAAATRDLGQRLRRLPLGRLDVVSAILVMVLSFTPGIADKGTALGWTSEQRPFDVLAALLVLGHGLALTLRSRAPGLCLLMVSSAAFVYQCVGYRPTFGTVALYIALYSVGSRQVHLRSVTAASWLVGYAALSVVLSRLGSPSPAVEYVEFVVLPVGCWLIGASVRSRLNDQERQQQRDLASALTDERDRLARDLHDVVTHHVTAVVMQAEALIYVPVADRPKVDVGLSLIAETGRRALTDLRDLLDLLSPTDQSSAAPLSPAIGLVDELVEQTRSLGQPVELVREGAPRSLGAIADLAAYRVAQEGLTNALKHAPGARTVVTVSYDSENDLVVDVRTECAGGPASEVAVVGGQSGSGRGLDGLRRRVELAGGELTTRRGVDGSFVVRAILPTTGPEVP